MAASAVETRQALCEGLLVQSDRGDRTPSERFVNEIEHILRANILVSERANAVCTGTPARDCLLGQPHHRFGSKELVRYSTVMLVYTVAT